jgi:hypothetical protein
MDSEKGPTQIIWTMKMDQQLMIMDPENAWPREYIYFGP